MVTILRLLKALAEGFSSAGQVFTAMARPCWVLALLCCAPVFSAQASNSFAKMLANTTVIPSDLLDNPFAGGRALLADANPKWDEWRRIGRYSQIANPQMSGRHL